MHTYPRNPHRTYTVAWFFAERDHWMQVARDTRPHDIDNTRICIAEARRRNHEGVRRARFLAHYPECAENGELITIA